MRSEIDPVFTRYIPIYVDGFGDVIARSTDTIIEGDGG